MCNEERFNEAEMKGRKKIEKFLTSRGVNDFYFAVDQYCQTDVILSKDDKVYTIEIKDRRKKYENYNTFIIEKSKIDYMTKLYKEGKTSNSYICQIFDNHFYFFSFTKLTRLIEEGIIKEDTILLPKTTIDYNDMTYKKVYFVPKKYAMLYSLNNGKYDKIHIN